MAESLEDAVESTMRDCEKDQAFLRRTLERRKAERAEAAAERELVETLTKLARDAREWSYSPYSGYRVGAALIDERGALFVGTNVECASYGLTTCAEEAALAAMVVGGGRQAVAILVLGPGNKPTPPCGACRQRILELGGPQATVFVATDCGEYRAQTAGQMLPGAFGEGVVRRFGGAS